MNSDTKFFTNEDGSKLSDRLKKWGKHAQLLDVLVGYFYSSGFHAIYSSLEETKEIRILIGISTSHDVLSLINEGNSPNTENIINTSELKENVTNAVEVELTNSEDSRSVETGVDTFIKWIRSGKLKIHAYPSQNIHAKLYIMTPNEGSLDDGRVITGSSNFSQSGLSTNLEFNVELKDSNDYKFAKNQFDKLWEDSVDVSEEYVETIENKTWFSDKVTPYHLYLKFLYEYFKSELNTSDELVLPYVPTNFLSLEYQTQAVLNAKKILLEFGGVFISDVVGLGKTYIASMLAKQLDGRNLVIAPPILIDKNNPGSWVRAFSDFNTPGEFLSIGKLDDLLDGGADKFQNIFIDEAHRMRNSDTRTYEKLAEICRGKRVILVSATPYNNSPKDIFSLVQLFQRPRNSTIPNLPNLDKFFADLEANIKKEDRRKDYQSYLQATQENAKSVRNNLLKYLMVRRTRSDIENFFSEDLRNQGLKFPEVEQPKALFYELNDHESEIFDQTINMLANQISYARYMPMTYYEGDDFNESLLVGQRNLGKFMKILLVKRLESSFYAFKKSIDRFLDIHEKFIDIFQTKGIVYTSKGYANKVFDLIESDNDEALAKLLEEDKIQEYKRDDFKDTFIKDLKNDKKILQNIKSLWEEIDRDPKLDKFIDIIDKNKILKENHLIIFTESKETARYIFSKLENIYVGQVICFDGSSSNAEKQEVINNFDANAINRENKFRILITTEVLAEGVNLHRSNIVINYDIPWNPTKLMQRIGRINRIDTPFEKIHTFNFFPSTQGDNEISLKKAAEAKIAGFLELLGGDAQLLTEGEEISSHSLFSQLNKIDDDEDSDNELKFLKVIKDIRENDQELFNVIKQIPKKARSSKETDLNSTSFITYFRRGRIQKFFLSNNKDAAKECDFLEAAKLLESSSKTKKEKISPEMFDLLEKNFAAFDKVIVKDTPDLKLRSKNDKASKLLKILKALKQESLQFTDEQSQYLQKLIKQVDDRALPKKTINDALDSIDSNAEEAFNPLKIIGALQISIPARLLKNHYAESNVTSTPKNEVVLSMYLNSSK